ncbi:MAG TPA: isoprenylcysteine carboxylmethyltransferase family protein [Candidatus Acidoferrum sp.]|nr:isoprenylcysteine carboxylmethyltransferase family protein [Candidatus Acidoferrum sp.]
MTLGLNRAVVFGSGAVYWAGVVVQARRVRRHTGKSTNTRPRNTKERLLWAGWFCVVVCWLALPFLSMVKPALPGVAVLANLAQPVGLAVGTLLMVAGYLGTLWCYAAMGNAWRMGINRAETPDLVTRGPYRLVRHPIYFFQVLMVAAIALLLPSLLACVVLVVHLVCVRVKAADEESHLRALLGKTYESYCAQTGAWLPRLRRHAPPEALPSPEHSLK